MSVATCLQGWTRCSLWSPSVSGRPGAGLPQQRKVAGRCQRSGGPAKDLRQLSSSAAAPQPRFHSSPSPGQGSGEQPEHGKQLVPRAEPSCGGSWTHLCSEAGELTEVWQCVAGPAAPMCQSKLNCASSFPFLASEALAHLPPKL